MLCIYEDDCSESAFLEPLTLGATSPQHNKTEAEASCNTRCLFCEEHFDVSGDRDTFLGHLVMKHQLVIADFKNIPHFKKYIEYWRVRFSEEPLKDFCTVIKTNSKETDQAPSEYYYLLCDVLPEDRQLRLHLQQQRLEEVLEQQQQEREDETFDHSCLFCRENFSGNKWDIFHHLAEEHAFNVGHPDNLVYKSEFIELLQQTLDSLKCLYCEKTFKDRHVLKEHMRKKQHKKINAQNKKYDKFYIINYLELGKTWEDIQSEDDRDLEASLNEDWSDWKQDEEGEDTSTVCLFCTLRAASAEDVVQHLQVEHGFDLHAIKQSLKLTFYQQVKLINYIRRRVHMNACSLCEANFSTRDELLHHLASSGHTSQVPPDTTWDHPEYFFPTYENDNLLCALEDEDEDDASHASEDASPAVVDGLTVVPEEFEINEAMARGRQLMEELRN